LKKYIKLTKLPISISVAISTLVGSYLTTYSFSIEFVLAMVGVFFLASAASAINQIQEWKFDAQMQRTHNRPLPAHNMTVNQAWIATTICLLFGVVLLGLLGWLPLFLGLLNIFFYNGLYTPLKRVTSFSVIPGSLVGAVPPMIGYAALGENIFDVHIMFFAMFMFLWQVPHFWLLAMKYSQEYIDAGFASITASVSDSLLKHLILVWKIAIAILVLFFPFFGVVQNTAISYIIIFLHASYLIPAIALVYGNKPDKYRKLAFISINSLLMLVSILIIIDASIR